MKDRNDFITYLNSLHNIGANGSYALAESQALTTHFHEIYEPFPIINQILESLTDKEPRVIIITGHAGDGKSSIALDIFKQLNGISPQQPLKIPLKEHEEIAYKDKKINIIKDISEISLENRKKWLDKAFHDTGSYLIISNTGPLIDGFNEFTKNNKKYSNIESKLLSSLDLPLPLNSLNQNCLKDFDKELIILNLTKADNIVIASKILRKIINHPEWNKCKPCLVENACPIQLNRKALLESIEYVLERVEWIYQRINALDQRLTLRQILSHLAFSLTGNMSCEEAVDIVNASPLSDEDRGTEGLEKIIFSEGFLGFTCGPASLATDRLQAVKFIKKINFGSPIGTNFERSMQVDAGMGWASLPVSFKHITQKWQKKSSDKYLPQYRFALRRLNYFFGKPRIGKEDLADTYLDEFIQLPGLREFDKWKKENRMTLSRPEKDRLLNSCLNVLLEYFSGFTSTQFNSQENLYITLRREDAIQSTTQLVISIIPFEEFDLEFHEINKIPVLKFNKGQAELLLTLPLFSFIKERAAGKIGNNLSPIHLAMLNLFREQLLKSSMDGTNQHQSLKLLKAESDGSVIIKRFYLDKELGYLEPI